MDVSRIRICEKTYTASSEAGPSNTAVIPSIVTVAVSLATYLESPLLYSFPVTTQETSKLHLD
jgi:hypothetical protein